MYELLDYESYRLHHKGGPTLDYVIWILVETHNATLSYYFTCKVLQSRVRRRPRILGPRCTLYLEPGHTGHRTQENIK